MEYMWRMRFMLVCACILGAARGIYAEDAVYDGGEEAGRGSGQIMERPESFLAVIEKMVHKYPVFKSKMYMMMKKNLDSDSSPSFSNPETSFSAFPPDPHEIYSKFKAIIDADQMLKEDMQGVLRNVQNVTEMLKIKKKNWLNSIKDLERDLLALRKQKSRAKDEISSTEIDTRFAQKYRKILKYLHAYEQGEKWEKELSSLLSDLFP